MLGVTMIAEVVEPVFHKKEVPPLTIRRVLSPAHNCVLPEMTGIGFGTTVTVATVVELQVPSETATE